MLNIQSEFTNKQIDWNGPERFLLRITDKAKHLPLELLLLLI